MGQKVNPNGFRYGITKERNSLWYADKRTLANTLLEDVKIYDFFEKMIRKFQIGQIQIVRNQKGKINVMVHTAKPGAVLGQGGTNIEKLVLDIKKKIKKRHANLNIEIVAIRKPNLNARLVAEQIAEKLENRAPFRIAQKFAIRSSLQDGAKGIKTSVSGRLNGVDMARTEGYTKGEMKLHTLRQNVDYGTATACTTYGAIGVKVWISKGEILEGHK